MSFLETGPVTREQVLLHLGTPEDIYRNEEIFDYKWIRAWDIGILLGPVGSETVQTRSCHILRFYFDENGTVEDIYVQSYKADTRLRSNKECHFDPAASIKVNVLKQKVSADYTFIINQQTTRQEVLQRLGWMDVGLKQDRFFWGRWATSAWCIAGPSGLIRALPSALNGGGVQRWTYHNLLVEFKESGVVVREMKVKDKDIVRILTAWSQGPGQRPADLSSLAQKSFAVVSDGWGRHLGWMRLHADYVEFVNTVTRTSLQISRDKIVSLELRPKAGLHPGYTLRLKDMTNWGNKINVSIDGPDLLAVLQYMALKNP